MKKTKGKVNKALPAVYIAIVKRSLCHVLNDEILNNNDLNRVLCGLVLGLYFLSEINRCD